MPEILPTFLQVPVRYLLTIPLIAVDYYVFAVPAQQAAFVLTQKVTSSLARDLLGWMPKKLTLSHGFSDYYAAWQASQGKLEIL